MGTRLKFLFVWVGVGLNLIASAYPATALEFQELRREGRTALLLKGEFKKGDTGRVAKYLSQNSNTQEILFHSPGGLLKEGIQIGQDIRRRSLLTRIPTKASCVSACVWAFLGGIIRIVDKDAKVGVHMATLIFNEELIGHYKTKLDRRSKQDIDVPLRLIMAMTEKAAAKAAAIKAEHLVKMGVSLKLLAPGLNTNQWDVYWLNRVELRDMNIMNTE